MTLVDVIIPSKSNYINLYCLVDFLLKDPLVDSIIVVSDGKNSWEHHNKNMFGIKLFMVEEGSGIHKMWNLGLENVNQDNHILFLNDDVGINESTISGMVSTLDKYSKLGIVCPNYSGKKIYSEYRPVYDTCSGRYDGTGGLGGFCMMLKNSLVSHWKFDERLIWWYGDDDIVLWVTKTMNMIAAICANSTCADNESWTINNDPPKNFYSDVINDKIVFYEKWSDK